MARPRRPVNAPLATLLFPALLLLAGCAFFEAPAERRGNLVDAELLRQVTPGVQTRNDVQTLLGSPSQTGTFDESEWYYISGISRPRPMQVPSFFDQRVVVVSFGPDGVVRGVRELDESNAVRVTVNARTTPVPGNERTVLQQLFANIGRVGPGGPGGPGGPAQ